MIVPLNARLTNDDHHTWCNIETSDDSRGPLPWRFNGQRNFAASSVLPWRLRGYSDREQGRKPSLPKQPRTQSLEQRRRQPLSTLWSNDEVHTFQHSPCHLSLGSRRLPLCSNRVHPKVSFVCFSAFDTPSFHVLYPLPQTSSPGFGLAFEKWCGRSSTAAERKSDQTTNPTDDLFARDRPGAGVGIHAYYLLPFWCSIGGRHTKPFTWSLSANCFVRAKELSWDDWPRREQGTFTHK